MLALHRERPNNAAELFARVQKLDRYPALSDSTSSDTPPG